MAKMLNVLARVMSTGALGRSAGHEDAAAAATDVGTDTSAGMRGWPQSVLDFWDVNLDIVAIVGDHLLNKVPVIHFYLLY